MDWLMSQPWFFHLATLVLCANVITMVLKDRYAEDLPIVGKLWPILNWFSFNVTLAL
mgnify:FL=1